MKYRLLGNSGLRVSDFALGTMTFGNDWGWGAAKDESHKVYNAFRDSGGNFIDTANLYTNGTSESFLGEFMKGHRESVVLATKYTNAASGKDPNAAGILPCWKDSSRCSQTCRLPFLPDSKVKIPNA
jgi:aryl-alcohol dehydrogenase-like predicted oxidoreductase